MSRFRAASTNSTPSVSPSAFTGEPGRAGRTADVLRDRLDGTQAELHQAHAATDQARAQAHEAQDAAAVLRRAPAPRPPEAARGRGRGYGPGSGPTTAVTPERNGLGKEI
jgi:hypothetical protein